MKVIDKLDKMGEVSAAAAELIAQLRRLDERRSAIIGELKRMGAAPPDGRKKWTPEMEEQLRRKYPEWGVAGCSLALKAGLPVAGIRQKASIMRVKFAGSRNFAGFRRRIKLSPESMADIMKNYPLGGCAACKVAIMEGHSPFLIRSRANELGLRVNIFTLEMDKEIREMYPSGGYKACRLCISRGKSRDAIYQRAHRMGVVRDPAYKRESATKRRKKAIGDSSGGEGGLSC